MKQFGEFLRGRRTEQRLTLKEVADVLGVGISYLSDVERGRRKPFSPRDLNRLRKLSEALDVDLDELRRLSAAERTMDAAQMEPSSEKQRELLTALFRKDHADDVLAQAIELLQEDGE